MKKYNLTLLKYISQHTYPFQRAKEIVYNLNDSEK